MTAGGISRRCRCRGADGKELGASCPKLKGRGRHGTYAVKQELPASGDGKRRTFRRRGFGTRDEAQDALDTVREILRIAEDDDQQDRDAIADVLLGLKPGEPLPDPAEVRRKLRAGVAPADRVTVGAWLDRWLRQETHRRATEVSYESHVRLYLKPKIGDIRLDRLTVGRLGEMFNAIEDDNDAIEASNDDRRALLVRIKSTPGRADKRVLREQLAELAPFRRPVGPTSRQRIKATLRAALNDAIAEQLITFNPAQHVEVQGKAPRPIIWTAARVEEWERTGERPGPVMVWTPTQAGRFLDYVAEHAPDEEAMWHLMLFRGPRRGEVAGLEWPDTDLDTASPTVQITQQLTEVEYKIESGAPKSDAGERTLPLDAAGADLLRAHRRRQREERMRIGPAWVDSRKVFTRPDGAALRPSWIGDRFEQHRLAAGLPPVRLHDLRHIAATLMLAAKVDLKVVQETLGHSALATTSDLYTSVLPEIASAAAEATHAVVPRAPRRTSGPPSGPHEGSGPLSAVSDG